MIISSIVLFLSSILMFIVAPEYIIFDLSLLILSIVLLLIRFRKQLNLRNKREKLILKNIITIILTLCIVGMINFISIKNSKDIDLTNEKIHSLTNKSKNILLGLNSKLELTVFAKRENWGSFLQLLNMYARESESVIVNAIDPISEPLKASQEGVTSTGEVVIKFLGRKESVIQVNELNITNAILKLVSNRRRNICFTQGHGEFSFKEKSNYGLSFLNSKILQNGYSLIELDLLDKKSFSKCDLVSSLGVKSDFVAQEILNLSEYLNNDGSFLVSLGPSFSDSKRLNLFSFLKREGIEVLNSVVIDRLASVYRVDATINVIDAFLDHKIVKGFKDKVFLPMSMNLKVLNANTSIQPFIQTKAFPATWAETNLNDLKTGKAAYDDKDIKGPNTLALAKEEGDKRIVVFGSEQFITNSYQGQSSNFNIFLNSIDWLLKQEELISLNRAGLKNESFTLATPAINTIFYFIILFCPFLFFGFAGFIYLRNKKL